MLPILVGVTCFKQVFSMPSFMELRGNAEESCSINQENLWQYKQGRLAFG
jgi:hypothetical protein